VQLEKETNMSFASCQYVNKKVDEALEEAKEYTDEQLAAFAPAFTDCEGAPVPGDAAIATCADLSAAVAAAGGDAQAAIDAALAEAKAYTDTETASTLAAANAYTDSEVSGALAEAKQYTDDEIEAAIDDLLTPNAAFTAAVQTAETKTTLAVSGVNYVYTNEENTPTVIEPGQFLSDAAGQSLTTDAAGRLFVNVVGLLPPDNTYSGSNLGTVDIDIEQDITDPSLITIRGDLKTAAQTPTNGTNLLTLGASGFYVSAEEVATEIADTPAAIASIQAALDTVNIFANDGTTVLFKAFPA